MILKVLALVAEKFRHVYWISCCNKILGQQRWHFYTVLLQFHLGNSLHKIEILDLILTKLLQIQ